MTNITDSITLTGPNLSRSFVNDLLVTPTGGSQSRLADALASAGGTPGGSNAQIQFNNNGAFGGLTTTGTGNAVLAASPAIMSPTLTAPTSDTLNLTTFNAGLSVGGSSILNVSTTYASIGLGFGAAQNIPSYDNTTTAVGFRAYQLFAAYYSESTAIGWGAFRSLTGAAYSLLTTSATNAGTVLNFLNTSGAAQAGNYLTGQGIPDNTTVASLTFSSITGSQNMTVASGAPVTIGLYMFPTTSTTTAGTVLNFASTAGVIAGMIAYSNFGGAIPTLVNVTNVTATQITVDQNVTIPLSANVYFANNGGGFNTAVGINTGGLMTTDQSNNLFGVDVMRDSVGSWNVGIGNSVMRDGTHYYNAVVGSSLVCNGVTTAHTYQNSFVGRGIANTANITVIHDNSVVGYNALNAATTAINNSIVGSQAGGSGTTMQSCAILGFNALGASLTGSNIIAIGPNALKATTAGSFMVAIGRGAMGTVTGNVVYHIAIGDQALTNWAATGSANTVALANVVIGAGTTAGSGSTATAVTAVGAGSVAAVTSGSRMAVFGNSAAKAITSGGTITIIGDSVAPTATTLTGSILIGVDSNLDSNVNDVLIIRGRGATAVPVLSATGINTALPVVSLPGLPASTTYANDAAAATGGVPVGGVYRNGSVIQVRVT